MSKKLSMKLDAYKLYLILVGATAFSFSLFATMSGVYRVDVGLTAMQLVLVGTMLELSVFIFEIPTGIVADVYSRRLSIIIGYGIIGLGFILEGSFRLVGAIWLAQWVWGLGYTFTSGAQSAWLADEIGEENLTAAFLRAAQVGTICGLLGVGASALIGTLNVGLPLLLGGAGMLLTTLFLLFFMPEKGFTPTPKAERDTWGDMIATFRKGAAVVRGSQILMVIFAISLCIGLSSEGLDRFWEAHFIRNFTFPTLWHLDYVIWFGIMNIGTSLITLAVTEFVRRRLDTEDEQKAIWALVVIELLMIVGIFTFAWAGNFTVALAAYWTTFVFRRTAWPIFDGWVNKQIAPQVRATVLSMHGQMDAIGQILSGPLMGVIATIGSLRIALTAVGGLWLAVIPLLLWGLALVRRKVRLQVA